MKQEGYAYMTWIDEKSARVSLKLPPTFMPRILLQPTTIITPGQNLNKSSYLWWEVKRAEEEDEVYISVMFEESQTTPCHFSPQGSPPKASHRCRDGAPKVMYKLLIAETARKQTPSQNHLPQFLKKKKKENK